MMIGEFEYEGIFYGSEEHKPIFPSMTYAFFVGFMIIMSIIIVNLLIGLAVDDIKAVQEQAILKRLAMQVELVLDVERLLPYFILRRLTVHRDTIRQQRPSWYSVFTDVVSKRSILQDVNTLDGPRQSNLVIADALETLQESIRNLRNEVNVLSEENRATRIMLAAMADKNSIYMDDDNESF